jgi:hypothetical protein
MHEHGRGIKQNHKAALSWYTKAGKRGHGKAQYGLGSMYKRGVGVETDYIQAYIWFCLAAQNGYTHNSEYKEIVARNMTSAEIYKAQDMASRCLDSGYQDC